MTVLFMRPVLKAIFSSAFHQFVYIRVNSWLAFRKLQTSGLPTVTEPFHQNNSPFIIEKPSLVYCLLFRSVRFAWWFPFFQNRYKSVFTHREKIADLARIHKRYSLFDQANIRRFVLLRFFRLRFWFLLFDYWKWRDLLSFPAG